LPKTHWTLGEIFPKDVINGFPSQVFRLPVVETPSAKMCLACRGAKLLCGKPRCPILLSVEALSKSFWEAHSQTLDGFSTGVFVGRVGYPKVYVGPVMSPSDEFTDTPELWSGISFERFIELRSATLTGRREFRATDARDPPSLLQKIQEVALSTKPTSSELVLESSPVYKLYLSEEVPPFGASALYRELSVNGVSADKRLERAYYDLDLDARSAITQLYKKGVFVSSIQRALSVGLLGKARSRRLVPTRWSITAVDSVLSEQIIKKIRLNPTVSEYFVFYKQHMESTYVGFLFPDRWSFEWVEAWQPNTVWNKNQRETTLIADHEYHEGRSSYAQPGGCYYAARLAASEYLEAIGRQARVILLREIHSGYLVPLGVWSVREAIRELFKTKPLRFGGVKEAVEFGVSKTSLPLKKWCESARLLLESVKQTKLEI